MILKLLRVRQWTKNAFVLAPLLFSFEFMDGTQSIKAGIAFLAFCFISSFVYIINDIVDRHHDALHAVKKSRPIACKKISVKSAVYIAVFMFLLSVGMLFILGNIRVVYAVFAYVALNMAYSFKLKRIVLIDVFAIAGSFLLRLYAGAFAINVPVSNFIFMTTLFLALFLGFSKRKAEMSKMNHKTRSVLKDYTLSNINGFTAITAALVIIFYALYTIEARTIQNFSSEKMIFSVIFVVYGIFRYFQILDGSKEAEDPTENLLRDKWLLGTCIAYVGYVLLVYFRVF